MPVPDPSLSLSFFLSFAPSSGSCRAERRILWRRRLQDRAEVPLRGSHAEETRESQRAVLFPFSSSSFPAVPLSLLHFPSAIYVDLLLSHTARLRFHLSLSSFPLERRRQLGRPGLCPFRIMQSPFLFSCSVLPVLALFFCFSSLLPVAAKLFLRDCFFRF